MNKKITDLMKDPVTIDKNQPLSIAMDKMDKNDLYQLPVTNNGSYHGTISYKDIAKELGSGKKSEKPASNLKVSSAYQKNSATAKEKDSLKETYCAFKSNNLYTISVLNKNKVKGLVRSKDLLKLIENQTPLSQTKIISNHYEKLRTDDRVVHARRKIIDNDYTALPITKNGDLAGLLTNREIAIGLRDFRKLVPDNKQDYRIRNLLIKDIMQVNPTIVNTNQTVKEISKKMLEKDSTEAIVLNGELIGILSHLDILRYWCGDER